ncbi:DUF2268 domain-containing putative Zn-dependent protease [Pleomorphomonas sp. JP5]|uniref:DUF2268 domain-containing putative Zn-dependent protease n=1 Tax=Pleomorphomonas sp. JP5 TaxID=2942998 RepID=UPI00204318A7|nr:DUF2268 domain-containing putative Zn-dependent protease [Pleomorphomonas sp. JP5]MCM5557117.1 DUF2268 domain-containing protein [Pleomorphomonas sp. JP5]
MDNWSVHWLEASGDLERHRAAILDGFEAAYRSLAGFVAPPRLDILVERLAGGTIPELGMVGHAYRDTLFAMTLDPDNPNFERSLRDGALRRQILHEVQHCMRMAGPGYGWTLGEALVSEGLAGRFVVRLLGSDPEPWERAVSGDDLRSAPVASSRLEEDDYDHAAWFHGRGPYPRWLGYSLGYDMVGAWLAEVGDADAATWIDVPASTVIEAARRSGLVS